VVELGAGGGDTGVEAGELQADQAVELAPALPRQGPGIDWAEAAGGDAAGDDVAGDAQGGQADNAVVRVRAKPVAPTMTRWDVVGMMRVRAGDGMWSG
jgi:hypothetical protein